ncbi:MAG: hypothetical protein ACK4MX_04920 [Thermaurantiacus sp.]
MRGAGCLVIVAGLWSLLIWWLRGLMVEPHAQVVLWSLRLGIDPNDSQAFAEWLEDTQVAMRLGLAIIWGAGLVLMAVLAVVSIRAEAKEDEG